MKAILVDSNNKKIKEVEFSGNYKEICDFVDCDMFTVVTVDEENVMYVDDEGLLKGATKFFKADFYHDQLAGNGLIIGYDSMGDSVGTTMNVEDVEKQIKFVDYDNVEDAPKAEPFEIYVL